jgi:hypothetical protein
MHLEISRSLETFKTSTNQYLVINEYFYMVIPTSQARVFYQVKDPGLRGCGNPCCDVTKTTVNEIKNVSKMADISLFQVKIFQELSKV